jgi:hypothetical protein
MKTTQQRKNKRAKKEKEKKEVGAPQQKYTWPRPQCFSTQSPPHRGRFFAPGAVLRWLARVGAANRTRWDSQQQKHNPKNTSHARPTWSKVRATALVGAGDTATTRVAAFDLQPLGQEQAWRTTAATGLPLCGRHGSGPPSLSVAGVKFRFGFASLRWRDAVSDAAEGGCIKNEGGREKH